MSDETEKKTEEAAERTAEAAEATAEAAQVIAVAELAAMEAQAADQGKVFDDGQRLEAQVAAANSAVAQLDARVSVVEAFLRRMGYRL